MSQTAQSFVDDLRAEHTAASDRLAAAAGEASSKALGASLVTVGMAAVRSVMPDEQRGGIREAASDAAAILQDPGLAHRLSGELRDEAMAIKKAVVNAVIQGYEAEARAHGERFAADSKGALALKVTITAADRQALGQFPIAGHGADDWTGSLIARLRMSFEGALVSALDQADPDSSVPAAVADAQRQHGDRVATLVREAYWAGTRAGNKDIVKALSRGR